MNRSSTDGEDIAGMTRESWEASKNVSKSNPPCPLSINIRPSDNCWKSALKSFAVLFLMTVRFVIALNPTIYIPILINLQLLLWLVLLVQKLLKTPYVKLFNIMKNQINDLDVGGEVRACYCLANASLYMEMQFLT